MLTELSWIARETLSGYQSALSIWAFLAVSYFLISRNEHLGSIKKIMWNKKNADFSMKLFNYSFNKYLMNTMC